MSSLEYKNNNMATVNSNMSVKPLFFKEEDVFPDPNIKMLSQWEVVYAAEQMAGQALRSNIDGAQVIEGLWRIYFIGSDATRVKLLSKGINLRGKHVILLDKNPYVLNAHDPEAQENSVRITIKDIPLSYDNDVIVNFLKDKNVNLKTDIRYCCIRSGITGKLTNYKNGDRYIWAEGPITPPLNRRVRIGRFRCRIYHDDQVVKPKCKSCGAFNHVSGDKDCPHYKDNSNVTPFAGFNNPLSNFYMPDEEMEIFGRNVKSAEHAWAYRKATENGLQDTAEQILEAEHAGKVFRISRSIDSKITPGWDAFNLDIMENIITEKLQQCEVFREALRETGQKLLAHSVPDKFWGSGLSDNLTLNTDPKHWPGSNEMGNLLMKVRDTYFYAPASDNGSDHGSADQDESFEEYDSAGEPAPKEDTLGDDDTTSLKQPVLADTEPAPLHQEASANASEGLTTDITPVNQPVLADTELAPLHEEASANVSEGPTMTPAKPGTRKREPTSEPRGSPAPPRGRPRPKDGKSKGVSVKTGLIKQNKNGT